MRLTKLTINNVRNIKQQQITLDPEFNIIIGENGSGKTSLLESIHLLGMGRSFRTHLTNRIISHSANNLTVFGVTQGLNDKRTPLGIEKSKSGDTKYKLGGEGITNVAPIAQSMPLQLINSDCFELINDGPKFRRQFIDWGLFHVKHSFMDTWKQYQTALKQRNAALKTKAKVEQIRLWDPILIEKGIILEDFRAEYIEQLKPIFYDLFGNIFDQFDIDIGFKRGWRENADPRDILTMSFDKDLAYGYTSTGPHRCDFQIKVNKVPVQDIFSRGQQKILVCTLRLAQGVLLKKMTQKSCIYLIDDLPAELDAHRTNLITDQLLSLKAQVFVTGITRAELQRLDVVGQRKLFHVKHGEFELLD